MCVQSPVWRSLLLARAFFTFFAYFCVTHIHTYNVCGFCDCSPTAGCSTLACCIARWRSNTYCCLCYIYLCMRACKRTLLQSTCLAARLFHSPSWHSLTISFVLATRSHRMHCTESFAVALPRCANMLEPRVLGWSAHSGEHNVGKSECRRLQI